MLNGYPLDPLRSADRKSVDCGVRAPLAPVQMGWDSGPGPPEKRVPVRAPASSAGHGVGSGSSRIRFVGLSANGCNVIGAGNISWFGMSSAVRRRAPGASAPRPLHAGDRLHLRITMTDSPGSSGLLARSERTPHPDRPAAVRDGGEGVDQHGSAAGVRR
jgi:hypothetical protein